MGFLRYRVLSNRGLLCEHFRMTYDARALYRGISMGSDRWQHYFHGVEQMPICEQMDGLSSYLFYVHGCHLLGGLVAAFAANCRYR